MAVRRKEVGAVFESLDEQIKHDRKESTSPRERLFLWVSVAIVSVLVFGGLYIGVSALD
jgi:Ni,Fe-hydrogenase I cytochrome b subunit